MYYSKELSFRGQLLYGATQAPPSGVPNFFEDTKLPPFSFPLSICLLSRE